MTEIPRAPQAALANLIEDMKVIVCVGSGGVGKTTTAAALALYGASIGKKTLVITIDPAKRLADALGLASLEHKPKRVDDKRLESGGVSVVAQLSAMTLDLKAAWDDLIVRSTKDPDHADRILDNRLYRAVSHDLPGAQDFIACESLFTLVQSGHYDLIVLDTPPTQNALEFLDAPARILDMLDTDAFRFLSTNDGGGFAKRLGLRFLDTAQSAVHLLLSRFTGTGFLDDLGDFLAMMRDIYEPVRERTRGLIALLKSSQCKFVVVTSPLQGPREEALEFVALLEQRGHRVGAVVANRVTPPLPSVPDGFLDALALTGPEAKRVMSLLQSAASESAERRREDEAAIAELSHRIKSSIPLVEVPRLDGEISDIEGLARLLHPLVGGLPR